MKINGLLFALLLIIVAVVTYFVTSLMLVPKRVGLKYSTNDKDVEELMKKINAGLDYEQAMCHAKVLPMIQSKLSTIEKNLIDSCNHPDDLATKIKSLVNIYISSQDLQNKVGALIDEYTPILCKDPTNIVNKVMNIISSVC